ncbi:MAG: DUF502 domain-containing protein [Endomicrobium sp.]|jgi:uncharacterized membrane protein|nr:DUF502 domain-containing protein [Endomicrobium sp.]
MIKQYNKKIKKYLIIGLIVIFPIWVILSVLIIFIKWISNFSFYLISYLLVHCKYNISLPLRVLSFFISIVSIIIVGVIINLRVGHTISTYIEKLIKKIPIVGALHSTAKQFISFIFCKNSSRQFKKVVFIPYPNTKIYSVAFVTGEQKINKDKYLSVFMPTTPNPTTGFLLFFKEEDILYTNYTVEQAFKTIISIGIITMDKGK